MTVEAQRLIALEDRNRHHEVRHAHEILSVLVLCRYISGDFAPNTETLACGFFDPDALPPLAFDHAGIVAAAVARLRGKSSYSTLPFFLLPERFTLTELQRTYEAILQTTLEKSNFRCKMEAWDVLEATDDYALGAQRPARLYRLKDFALFDRSVG